MRPGVDAISYGCDTTSDSTWRTVSLTSSATITFAASSIPITSQIVSYVGGTSGPSPSGPSPSGPSGLSTSTQSSTTFSSGPIQDLTLGQKVGIGTGCGCAFLFITWGIILRIRRQKRESNDIPLVMLDEKSPVDQVEKVQGQDSVMEEMSSQ